jgi:OOP family OmpA-OmpF porin
MGMRNSKWIKGGLVSLVMAFGASSASATESGFYMGLNLGQSTFGINEELEDALQSVPNSGIDDSDSAWALVAGYRFNPYFGLELSYVDLGEASAFTQYQTASTYGRVDLGIESNGLALALVPAIPAGIVEFNPRLGLYIANTEATFTETFRSTFTSYTETESDDVGTESVFFGLGIGVTIADHLHLRFDWTRYNDVGDEEEISYEEDIETLTIGIAYRF